MSNSEKRRKRQWIIYYDYLLADGVPSDHIIKVSLDLKKWEALRDGDAHYHFVAEAIRDEELYYVFLDEIQLVEGFEEVVNSIKAEFNTDVYQRITKRDFPFPLIYLVLPLVLPRQIRTEISSRTQLTNWVQRHQELIYNFGKRARDLVEITNEALEFMVKMNFLHAPPVLARLEGRFYVRRDPEMKIVLAEDLALTKVLGIKNAVPDIWKATDIGND